MSIAQFVEKPKIDWALFWAARGFLVFPLLPNSKKPAISDWPNGATHDPEALRRWWARWPDANIGLACGGGVLVLDVDEKNGVSGLRSLLDLDVPWDTFTTRTPSGGFHLFFSGPDRTNSAGKLGPGLDARGVGGYVVGAGSTINGVAYAITHDAPILDAPAHFLARLDMPRERNKGRGPLCELDGDWALARAVDYLRNEAPLAVEGLGGDTTTFSVAAKIKDFGVSETSALDLMAEHWNERCAPPWTREGLEEKTAHAFRYGRSAPGADNPAAQFAGVNVPAPEVKPEARPANRFPLVSFSDIRMTAMPEYLIKGLLPRRGLAVVWGPPKSGKSFLVVDMVSHVALGWKYRDRRVKQGTVVYCALEGADGFRKRAQAFRLAKLRDVATPDALDRFKLMAAPLALVSDRETFVAALAEQLGGERPAVVVIDTLNRSFEGSESKDADMTAYVRAATTIIERFDCLVVIVHHCGLNEERMRGSTALKGALEVEISIARDGSENIVAKVECAKDMATGEPFYSRLEFIPVGVDEDGDAITSGVVWPADGDAEALRILKECLGEMLQFEAVATKGNELGVSERALRDKFGVAWAKNRAEKGKTLAEGSGAKTFARNLTEIAKGGMVHVSGAGKARIVTIADRTQFATGPDIHGPS